MIGALFRLLLLGIAIIVLLILFAPRLIVGAGNALINSSNDPSVSGLAQLVPNSPTRTDLQIKLDGLIPNAQYDVSLDSGGCSGNVVKNVGTVQTDAHGTAIADKPVSNLGSALQQPLWLDVHQGSDVAGQSVACGQVQTNNGIAFNSVVTPTPPTIPQSASSGTTSTISHDESGFANSDTPDSLNARKPRPTGFPNTGVAPGSSNTYDNYTFPRKY